ncbi:unnamed protein product [Tilletia controversa]|uniref:Ubiquitin carboxyl-terminal hydrolase n=3 Tax=Tilletia TaxID=13289 RepID=A0A8X7MTK3_9BASI|nr:hypothetical protein CF336_g3690 [Tilletia laevis]KAE8198765.1 hypothetical protein CF328_g3454 [Tilletia controversa]KAE8261627.1 hypothetical protein A4X03_0g3094 [Tilletia caries]KAE8203746.1 hypothetical protein CF335_g2906 [Tilletia laevis]KAE8248125.1 hypothetical protein A4X06_0g3944 [Tilletia controversa]
MSFSWRGIFHKHDHSESSHHGGRSSTPTSGLNGTSAGPSHSNKSGGAGGSVANGSASASATSTSLTVPASVASDPSTSGSAFYTNGHAVHGSGSTVPTTVHGDVPGPNGGMVARLRVWEELERPDMPLLGFENFGNTCYANSVLQALYHCQPFRESILKHRDENPPAKTVSTPAPLATPPSKANSSAEATQQASIPCALQDLFAQMTDQSIATAQAAQLAAFNHSNAAANSTGSTGFSAKRTFGGLSMGGLGGIPPVTTNPVPNMGVGFSMGAIAGSSTTASQSGGSAGAGSAATGGKDGPTKRAVDQTAIKAFLAALRKENVMFDSTMHQDAHEMLNFVLNRVGEELVDGDSSKGDAQSTSNTSPAIGSSASGSSASKAGTSKGTRSKQADSEGKTCVHRLFEGKLTNETRCMTCETVSSRDESFLDLSIDIEQNSSVTSCLRQFSASETLRARNKFFCNTCSGLQEAEKRMKVKELPNVLALHLKRFKYEESVQKYIKLAYRVVFPMQLRLFNTSDVAANPDRMYTLFAIVVHIGAGLHSGHYIAIVKVGSRWISFDDDTVETIDEMDIAKYFGDTPGTGSAYVLFYQADDLDRTALGLPPIPARGSNSTLSLTQHPVLPPPALPSSPGAVLPAPAMPTSPLLPPPSPRTPSLPRPSTADGIRPSSSFNGLRAPSTIRARTPSPGDALMAAAGLQDPIAGANSHQGTPSRMGALALLGHRKTSRQATLPLGLEAQLGLSVDGKGSSGPNGSVPTKGSRKSLVGRFGFGKSSHQ